MSTDHQPRKGFIHRFLHSWQAPALLGVLFLIATVVWMFRVKLIVPFDGTGSWDARLAPPVREVVWESAKEIGRVLPEQPENTELITPRLTDSGATLYFTRRSENGQADIYRSRLEDGQWQPGAALDQLNSEFDEIGPALNHDGRRMYFYSNRPGGHGGYDIYSSELTQEGWSSPTNLGRNVNTLGHEYDPAIAPDGLSLFFASNRDIDTEQQSAKKHAKFDPWKTTLRARLGSTQFDLYTARRETVDVDWQLAEPLTAINRPLSDEGAPFVSSDGAFLYFASDRPFRSGEDSNLDLYRVRRNGNEFGEPENLGPSINSAAHETEPALSPEGYTLVFSSNREGNDRLYVSAAKEVYVDSGWGFSALPSISRVWWWALAITLLLTALLAIVLYFRGTLVKRAIAARFFLGSVMVHTLVLLMLFYWTFPELVEEIVTKIQTAFPSTDVLNEAAHQSHEDGREAYEKVADLKSLDQVPVPQMVRQETDPLSVPDRTENPLPTIPMSVARTLPPNRVLYLPPEPKSEPEQKLEQLQRRPTTSPMQPIEMAEVVEPLPAAAEPAAERPIDNNVDLARQQADAPMPLSNPSPLARKPLEMRRTVVDLDAAAATPLDEPDRQPDTPLVAVVRMAALPRAVESVTETVAATGAADKPTETQIARADTTVARAVPETTPAQTQATLPDSLRPLPRRVPLELAAVDSATAKENTMGAEPVVALDRNTRPVPIAGVLTQEEAVPVAADESTGELPVQTADVLVARAEAVSPKPGLIGTPDLPRRATQPVLSEAIALLDPTIDSSPLSINAPVDLLAGRTSDVSELKQSVVEAAENPDMTALATKALAETELAAVSVAVSRTQSLGPTPTQPTAESVNPPRLPARRIESSVARLQPKLDVEQPMSSDVPTPMSRTTPQPVIENAAAPARTEDEVKTIASDRPNESAISGVEVAVVRISDQFPQFDVRTPNELTGPAMLHKHRLIIGALSDERNDAPPTFSPLASRLDRRPARATRVAIAHDNVGLRSMFTLRQGDTRKQYIELFGGTNETEQAVNLGLEWLAKQQEKEGHWDLQKHGGNLKSHTAATGLALLPFLAAGHTHQSGQYQANVTAGLKWLVDHQNKDTGDLLASGDGQHMYSVGIAAISLCEAYGMTQDPALKPAAQLALDFICKAQHQESGGWRYSPNQAADTSVVGWQMMALKSGEIAGLTVPKAAFDNVARWLASVEAQPDTGTFGYTSRSPNPAMSAEGLLSLQFMGTGRNEPRMRSGANYLLAHPPKEDQQLTSYYWYYATQAMYHMQGSYWETWNQPLSNILVKTQEKSGATAGTWAPRDRWETSGGRIYSTSLKLLMLEVYYRHLPLYEQVDE